MCVFVCMITRYRCIFCTRPRKLLLLLLEGMWVLVSKFFAVYRASHQQAYFTIDSLRFTDNVILRYSPVACQSVFSPSSFYTAFSPCDIYPWSTGTPVKSLARSLQSFSKISDV